MRWWNQDGGQPVSAEPFFNKDAIGGGQVRVSADTQNGNRKSAGNGAGANGWVGTGGGIGASVRTAARTSGKARERGLAVATWAAAALTVGALLYIIIFILVRGVPNIRPELFSLEYTSENVSLMPALISTVMMTLFSLAIAAPIGIFAAIYLTEYAKRGNKAVALMRMTAETLSGIPSIVYGLFGLLFFVTTLGWGFSVLAGSFTLAIMILPLILRSTEEAIIAVPDSWREGSFGLGAGRLRTVFRVVMPAAVPGIMAGIILAVGRIVGETAALVYTAGTVAQVPVSPMQSARTLSVHMYALSSEGLHVDEGYATAVVLLVVVIAINTMSARIAKRFGSREKNVE